MKGAVMVHGKRIEIGQRVEIWEAVFEVQSVAL
jgi:hypothetical protein